MGRVLEGQGSQKDGTLNSSAQKVVPGVQSGKPLEKTLPCVLTSGNSKTASLGFSLTGDDSEDPQYIPPGQLGQDGWMGKMGGWVGEWMDGGG